MTKKRWRIFEIVFNHNNIFKKLSLNTLNINVAILIYIAKVIKNKIYKGLKVFKNFT